MLDELEFSNGSMFDNLSSNFESDTHILNANSQPNISTPTKAHNSDAVITVTPTPYPEAVIAATLVAFSRRQDSLFVQDIRKITTPFSIMSNGYSKSLTLYIFINFL